RRTHSPQIIPALSRAVKVRAGRRGAVTRSGPPFFRPKPFHEEGKLLSSKILNTSTGKLPRHVGPSPGELSG
ncbi:hypothetical protein ACFLRB_06760, partial [Acidobacteriota bacterium]